MAIVLRDLTPAEIAARDGLATNAVAPATNMPKAAATNKRSANRRDKGAFNAYQRDYMRKRRAAKKAKA